MPNVIQFTPRQRPPEPAAPVPLAGISLRLHLEGAAQTALDAADKIIAALDRIDGDTAVAFRSEAAVAPAPLGSDDCQGAVGPGESSDDVTEESETRLPELALPEPVEPVHEAIPALPLRWGGRGNIVAAAGVALVDLVARKEAVATP